MYLNFTGLVSREYFAPLYPHALPAYLGEDLKRKKQCYKDKVILDSQPTQFHNETTRKTLKNNFESYANVVVETCVEAR